MEKNKVLSILIHGELGKNPDLRYSENQEAVCILSVAENNSGDELVKLHRIVVWGRQAELCSLKLKKGSPVFVRGQKITRCYRDKDGQQKGVEEIQAQTVGISFSC